MLSWRWWVYPVFIVSLLLFARTMTSDAQMYKRTLSASDCIGAMCK
jgi:hypothetical protein